MKKDDFFQEKMDASGSLRLQIDSKHPAIAQAASLSSNGDGHPLLLHLSEENWEFSCHHGHWVSVAEELDLLTKRLSFKRVVPRILPTLHWVDESHPAWNECRPKEKRFRIACDFDEVIHQGVTAFTTPSRIEDPPFPGAMDWIRGLLDAGVFFIVHTCRLTHWSPSNPYLFHEFHDDVEAALKAWFIHHGLEQKYVDQIHFWRHVGKPSADCYIDDKAWRFAGKFPSADELKTDLSAAKIARSTVLE